MVLVISGFSAKVEKVLPYEKRVEVSQKYYSISSVQTE
jgi:hypothetical protein